MKKPPVVLPDLNLQPGEIYLARSPAILRTILGSCVSCTFWCGRLRIGALSHGVLPRCPVFLPQGFNLADGLRFVDFSIDYLSQQLDSLGARRDEIEVKLFGGADVLPTTDGSNKPTVGALNCISALEVLEKKGFTVSASDLRGIRGRRIHFNTATGEILLQRLKAWRDPLGEEDLPEQSRIRSVRL
jgi:chemotaxis protein CheD